MMNYERMWKEVFMVRFGIVTFSWMDEPSSEYLVSVLTLLNTKHFVNHALHDVQTALSCVLLQPCVHICGLMQAVWATGSFYGSTAVLRH